jgi:hypothetical protein
VPIHASKYNLRFFYDFMPEYLRRSVIRKILSGRIEVSSATFDTLCRKTHRNYR